MPMQNPFDETAPDPRAMAAARELMGTLPQLTEGRMFGVLVVSSGEVLRAVSGDASFEGFAPSLYDLEARAQIEPQADRVVKGLTARLPSLGEMEKLTRELEHERTLLKARHSQRREARHRRGGDAEESRADKRERRQFETHASEQLARFAPVVRRKAAIERLRRIVSQEAMRRIHDTLTLTNAWGERVPLRALFAPGEPPWGAAECAAVKLLQLAISQGLTPVALAEFWWGPPPPGGGRVHAAFYPACRTKCGPVLPFLLRGFDVSTRQAFRSSPAEFETLYEDEHLLAVVKPSGMLSVPGKEESDSVLTRLRQSRPDVMLVHRLDLDTSGVLLAARGMDTYRELQARWSSVRKRYVAWLDGEVAGERGTVSLPLRVDFDQRPRQVVDFQHGRGAVTDWQVLRRREGQTNVAFFPRTGRTHQLRVHAAHRDGLGAPIVGDRLYGRESSRLMLHAEELSFSHPVSGQTVVLRAPSPF